MAEPNPAAGAPELTVVVGPTASGKTDFALALARAQDGEIIGADSVQIYRRFDIGSGKPTAEQLRQVRHHLVDCVDPTEPFDAARYVTLADEALADVRQRGKRPILCGGSFLWVKALLFGLAAAPPADVEIRQRHERWAERDGRAALHQRLTEVDPTTASRLAPNDLVRVSRALEVYELSGIPLSRWHAEHGFREPRYRARLLGVDRDRAELDRRIETRTAAWLEQGWIDEVSALLADGLDQCRAMSSVGYRQVCAHLRGELPRAELAAAIVRATRTFVRRQRTWLRDEPVRWVADGGVSPDGSVSLA